MGGGHLPPLSSPLQVTPMIWNIALKRTPGKLCRHSQLIICSPVSRQYTVYVLDKTSLYREIEKQTLNMYRWREPMFRIISHRCLDKTNVMRSLNDSKTGQLEFLPHTKQAPSSLQDQ
jgi:hypothetical protein